MIEKPGLYPDMSEDLYHSDPAPTPSLSSSLARLICDKSVLHARYASPRFAEKKEEVEPSSAMTLGTAAHSLALGVGKPIVALEFDDYRSKAAREARDMAILAGKVPLKPEEYEHAKAIAGVVQPVLRMLLGDEWLAEQSMFWRDPQSKGWRRGRIDAMSKDGRTVVDLKTVGTTAEPDAAGRSLYVNGYHIQEALYRRGLDVLVGKEPRHFYFLVVEQSPPYAYSIHALDAEGRDLGESQVMFAGAQWDLAVSRDVWPAYGTGVNRTVVPSYIAQRWYGAALREEGTRSVEELLDATD